MKYIVDDRLFLPDNARAYYEILKPMREWNNLGILFVVHLARMFSMYEKLVAELEMEGLIINRRENPKYKISEKLYNSILLYSRFLKIDAFNYIGRARDNQNKNYAKYKIVKTLEKLKDDELIALPIVYED
jgi:hypothetical protein